MHLANKKVVGLLSECKVQIREELSHLAQMYFRSLEVIFLMDTRCTPWWGRAAVKSNMAAIEHYLCREYGISL